MRLFVLAILLFCTACLGDEATPDRILSTLDFEERRLGNAEELPMHWSKIEGPGRPHYVNGRLANDRSRSGEYSFRFDLNGGSLAYRYSPGRVKVRPRSHYRVETWVQTTPLAHARARLTAYFLDQDRRVIASSVRHSPLYAATAGESGWKQLRIDLSADPKADSLVVELGVLQPALHSPSSLEERTLFPQDIRGSAWFDDVTISQVPRVRMTTDRPANVFRRGDALSLQVTVNDRSTDDLEAQLVVKDAAGQTVFQRSGALDMTAAETPSAGIKKMRLVLPAEMPAGWYEAMLVMTSKGQFVGRQSLDLVLLADDAKGQQRPDDRFGVIATHLPFDGWAELPDILPYLGTGRVKLAVWNGVADIHQSDSAAFDALLVRFQELGITPTACLLDLPPAVAQRVGGSTWKHLLQAPPETWKPQLAYMVSRHANHLDRWQLGADGSDAFVANADMRKVYDLLYGEFRTLVQRPDLAMPWPAWYELNGQLPATVALGVHPNVLPHQLPLYMQDISRHSGHNLSLSLEVLPREKYGRDVQVRDLAQRVIYALAGGAERIDLPLPFNVVVEEDGLVKQPQELLMVIRTLTTTLGGTTFKGKVPIAEGVEAFLFDRGGQSILALWDSGLHGGVKQLALTMGERPRKVDLWGNTTPLLRPMIKGRGSGQIQLTLSQTPVFLVDIDGQLAQLRASLVMDRPLLESSFKPHARKIRFSNPYPTALSGTLRLKPPAGWTMTPASIQFNVNPGETFTRDLVIEFPYNSYAGTKTVQVEFQLQDNHVASTTVPLTLNLGLTDVGMQTLAIRDGRDVLVQQIITNYGDRPIDYNAFAIFPGFPRQERLVTNLAPGRTTIKLYRFANAAADKTKLRTGLKELAGSRILNDEVEIN